MLKLLFSFILYFLIFYLSSCTQPSKQEQAALYIEEKLKQIVDEKERRDQLTDYFESLRKKETNYSKEQTHENEESSSNEVSKTPMFNPYEFIPEPKENDKYNKNVKEIYERLRKENKHKYALRDSLFREREKQIKKRQKKLDSLREALKDLKY